MSSILQGYEYDIFISYRQKDNKHDGWVTEFVDNLKGELESTFKEEVSVYFDINPHDGLLETNDISASLNNKLKCLIFIPIISRTYCDPKSFAWEHEFKAFVEQASKDKFGLKIKLPNGNVSNRVLPVRIHDIDTEDKELLENELDGALRSIDFIYKESGVNRSLKPTDNRNENQNKTDYRNQVNKTANVIKEIIGSLKNPLAATIKSKPKDHSDKSLINDEPFESIAVLPFANMSSDPEQEFFSEGISEEIINVLAQVPGLKVAGRTSSFSFKGKNQDLRLVGEQLNVNHILEGSVRKSGNKLRIIAQLINVTDGYHLWSGKYDRELEDIFELQDEISLAILDAIKIKLLGDSKEAILKKYTDNPVVFQLYLQGRFYYNLWSGVESFSKAIDYFRAAIKIEPDYALAYAGIATSYFYLWFLNLLPPEKCLPQMKQAAQRSLELDNEIAESHLAMGYMKMYYEWDFKFATNEFKKALELNPNIAEAHEQYAMCLGLSNNYKEAIKHASIAYNLDPLSLFINFQVPVIYWMAGDYERVLEYGKRLVELDSNFYGGYLLVASGLMGLRKYEEAVPEIETAIHRHYGCITLNRLGLVYGLMGEKEKAMEILEKMLNLVNSQWVGNCDIGIVYMALGDFDKAFDYFEKAIEKHEGIMLLIKHNFRYYPKIEKDPRIKKLLGKIGLPDQK
jgi:adenylate cyclase